MVCLIFFGNRLMSSNKPNPEKLSSYECGEEPIGSAWLPFNSRFYVIALIFLLFEVEMVFVFPWATVFGSHEINNFDPRWGTLSLIEMFLFLGILILGLVYVWVKGDLDWIKPKVVIPTTDVKVPASMYDKINTEQSTYKVREFSMNPVSPIVSPAASATPEIIQNTPQQGETAQPIRKPMFKPSFKKPSNES